jgi:ubiquitin-like protein Pup
MPQERVQKSKSTAKREAKLEEDVQAKKDQDAEALKAESDALLDEIDALLEENAEEFVKGYVQKGGE